MVSLVQKTSNARPPFMLRNFGVKGKIKNDLRVYLVAYTFSAKLHVLLALDHNQ